MMLPFLCAHPTYDLAQIEGLGFRGIRFDVRSQADIQALDRLSKHPKLTPLGIVDKYDLVIPLAEALAELGRGAIELVNEPNLNGWNPRDWAGFTKAAYPAIKVEELNGVKIPVVSGGISNLNHRELGFLAEALKAGLECDVVGFHRYQTEKPPSSPLHDYQSRAEEFAAVRALAGGRPCWNTEIGWHDSHQGSNWKEQDVAHFAVEELAIERAAGVPVMCWYQLPDGPGPSYEDHFGIMRLDGSLKPVAHSFGGQEA